MSKNRSICIDLVKALAIILVVIGHCIQYGSGSKFLETTSFFCNKIFIFIYSFHMPLFAVVSGYLFFNSINKYDTKTLVKRKLCSLLIPLLTFSAIFVMLQSITSEEKYGFSVIITSYLNAGVNVFWFLFALIVFEGIVILNKKLLKDNIATYVLLFVVSLFITPLKYATTLYIYPYFIIGYLYNRYSISSLYTKWKKIIIPITIIMYGILILNYGTDSYIYTSGYCVMKNGNLNMHQLKIDVYRFFVGLFGVVSVISTLEIISGWVKGRIAKSIEYISRNTIVIYLISCILNIYILAKLTKNLSWVNYFFVAVESSIMVAITLLMGEILKKNKITKILFLGDIN